MQPNQPKMQLKIKKKAKLELGLKKSSHPFSFQRQLLIQNIDFLLLDCQVYVLDIGDLPRLLTEYSIRKYYKYSQEKRDNTADAVKLINCFTEKSVLQRIFLKKVLKMTSIFFSHIPLKKSLIQKCIFGSKNTHNKVSK